jgi:hypothetical protein
MHPTLLSELADIIYAERLQEAEQSRRLAAIGLANDQPWFFSLSRFFKSKSDKPTQPLYKQPVSEGK